MIEKPENLLHNKSTEGDERMYCWNCGAENEDESRFCWKCGANLQELDELPDSLTEPEEFEKSSKAPFIIAITACIILCVVIAGAVVFYWYFTTTDEVSNDSQEKAESSVSETNGVNDTGEEKENADDEDTHAVDAVVDEKEDSEPDNGETESNQDYILPDSSSRILSDSEVSVLSKEELRLARNEIYARHGRKFDDVQLQSYFDSKSWYKGTIDPADFSESMLSEIEKKNIELIKMYE